MLGVPLVLSLGLLLDFHRVHIGMSCMFQSRHILQTLFLQVPHPCHNICNYLNCFPLFFSTMYMFLRSPGCHIHSSEIYRMGPRGNSMDRVQGQKQVMVENRSSGLAQQWLVEG